MKIISAYVYIEDYTSTEKYLRKLLLYIDSNDTTEEGWLHLNLADILHAQSKKGGLGILRISNQSHENDG